MISIFDVFSKKGKVFLVGRDEGRRIILEDTNEYSPAHGMFYVKNSDIDVLEEFESIINVKYINTTKKSLFGDPLTLIHYVITDFDKIKELRELIEKHRESIFEGDLYDTTLYCLDRLPKLGYSLEGKWRVCYMDIETEVREGFPDANNPTEKVLCSTFYDNYTNTYHCFYWEGEELTSTENIVYHRFESEGSMLTEIVRWLAKMQFDVLTGWNINFDVGYLFQRFLNTSGTISELEQISPLGVCYYKEKYKEFKFAGVNIFDLLGGYKRIVRNELASFKLDNVAEEELGEKKIEVDIKTLSQIPKSNLLAYNKKDVELCIKIDEKVGIFNFFDGLRQFVGCTLDETKYSRSIVDFMILKKARTIGVVLPTGSNQKGERPKFEGAFVDAVQGSYRNVIAFDIKGLYPNIMKTFNLSIECCREKDMNSSNVHLPEVDISFEKEGIIPSIINDLMVLRKYYDEERDKYPAGTAEHEKNDVLVESAKLVVDAIYGLTAFPQFRLYKPEIASSITYIGRETIKHTKQFIEDLHQTKVVVTDTDSSYFISTKTNFNEIVEQGNKTLEILNKEYIRWVDERWRIKKCYLQNVFKKIYKRLIVGTKKRYCGHVVWAKGIMSDKTEVVGLEYKRSDFSRFARDTQFQLMKMLLHDESDKAVQDYLLSRIREMKQSSFSLIGIPTKIEKNLEEYTTNLPKVRGTGYSSKILNEKFVIGDKPLLLFTRGLSDVILFFNDTQAHKLLGSLIVDWEKMIDRNIILPTQMLLESDGRKIITSSLELVKKEQSSLSSFI